MKSDKSVFIIGYSGHAYVVCDIFESNNYVVKGYFENEMKNANPYKLEYMGSERQSDITKILSDNSYFTCIGNNIIRRKVDFSLFDITGNKPINAIHKRAYVAPNVTLGNGVMVSAGSVVNSGVVLGSGVICNTNSTIEHECEIGDYSHIAPGTVLCGAVRVGSNSFIGAGSVIKQNIVIGDNVIVGAGTVVLNDIKEGSKVVGNPQKYI